MHGRVAALMVACGVIGAAAPAGRPDRPGSLPAVVVWAWERADDLRFVDPATTGVAYLDRTILVRGAEVRVRPRLQPLHLPAGARRAAVVRVEADAAAAAEASIAGIAGAAAAAARAPGLAALQIDFDATASQRAFYTGLLHEIRARLPPGLPLSMTALASWCDGDPWLDSLPVDEVVPMLFEMGPDDGAVRRRLRRDRTIGAPVCRRSVGLAIEEPVRHLPGRARTYLFSYRPWTAERLAAARREIAR